jgi:hypothetical protein
MKLQQEPLRGRRRERNLSLTSLCQGQTDLSGGMLGRPRPGVRRRARQTSEAGLDNGFAPLAETFPRSAGRMDVARKGA